MAVEVVMPKLGWSMEVGSLVEWLKADGQMVQPGEILFTVESDKAVTEVEALEGGTLRIPPSSPLPGEPVPVGTVLAYLVQPDELAGIEVASPSRRMVAADEPAMGQGPELEGAATGRTGEEPRRPAISPRARRLAAELSVNWAGLQGSGRTGRIVERDIRGAAVGERPAGEIRISPLARRLGEEAGVDLAALARRLPGKRITRQDVEEAIQQRASSHPRPGAAGTAEGGSGPGARASVREPLSATRRAIRDRLVEAARTTVPVTLTADADATELVALRVRLLAAAPADGILRPPTYNDLLVRLVARALLEHPGLNSWLEGDTLVRHGEVHMGLAVDTPRGLLVPVIRNAHRQDIWAIAEESARLVEQARAGTIPADGLRGSTFTITNLGGLDVDAFTPVLNVPECAILGVGKIALRPAVDPVGERIVPRHTVTLSLTFDHRAVDGAPAARFLQAVKRLVEKPPLESGMV